MARKFLGGKPVVGTGSDEVVVETLTITATDPVLIDNTTSADLSANRTISVKAANTSGQAGVVSLTDSTSTTSSTLAATATAVKNAFNEAAGKVATSRQILTTSPITGGGDLSTDRTIAIDNGTTTQKGAVQLSDSTSTNASTKAATEKAVYETKLVADAAIAKSLVTTIGDLIIGAGTPAVPTRLVIGATSGSVLTSNGTTASWSAAPTLTNATIATPTLTLSTTTNNAEGRIAWDGTNDQISVGDGAAQAVFGKLTSTNPSDLGAVAVGNATTAARANHVHATTGLMLTTSPTIVADFSKSGTLALGTGTFRWYNDSGSTLYFKTIRASCGTAPTGTTSTPVTGASLVLDVNVNGTTIWATQTDRVNIQSGANTGSRTAFGTTSVTNGQYLTVDIDFVGSTVAGADLTVSIWLSYA